MHSSSNGAKSDVEPNFHYRLMVLTYKVRDFFAPRREILDEVGIKPGFQVLDCGCGPGSYIAAAAELIGASGILYALDVHPLAIELVNKIASERNLGNVKTIHSDCKTGLQDGSIDVLLLYDALHDMKDPESVLAELHRVLKPNGILSFSDHHLKEDEVVSRVTDRGLFKLLRKGKKTYSFSKQ